MSYGERLKKALAEAGYSQSALAREIGVKPQAIQHLCTPGEHWSRHHGRIAKALGISPEWLESGIGPMRSDDPLDDSALSNGLPRPVVAWEKPEDLPDDDYVLVQRVYVKPAAGQGALVFEEEEGPPLAFSTRWIKRLGLRRRDLYVVEAQGDSMEPTIYDGDVILLDSASDRVVDGQIYVLRYGDELKVKRLFRRYDGTLIIRSDNASKYPDETVPPTEDGRVAVLGKVVWRAGGVD